jgi:hypothetical protein
MWDFEHPADAIFLARRRELRELVETSQAQVESLRRQLQEVEKRASEAELSVQANQKELERALPFEKEVKEKNLLIGKLRHEAVILNDHLTKALRFLKRGNPEDNVDRLESRSPRRSENNTNLLPGKSSRITFSIS